LELCIQRVKKLNPNIAIFPVSAKTGEGMLAWYDWLYREVKEANKDESTN